jgi:hypothetical protein
MEHRWNEIESTRRNNCPSATLSTTNFTWTDSGSNPGLRVERPVTNHLSHGTAKEYMLRILRTLMLAIQWEGMLVYTQKTLRRHKGRPSCYFVQPLILTVVIWREVISLLYYSAILSEQLFGFKTLCECSKCFMGAAFLFVCSKYNNRDMIRYSSGSVEETQIWGE